MTHLKNYVISEPNAVNETFESLPETSIHALPDNAIPYVNMIESFAGTVVSYESQYLLSVFAVPWVGFTAILKVFAEVATFDTTIVDTTACAVAEVVDTVYKCAPVVLGED
jgi:hypothetical protein